MANLNKIVESDFNLDTELLYGFWINIAGDHRILLPCDLMSHTRAQIDNNISSEEIRNWREVRWFSDDEEPNVRIKRGELYHDDNCEEGVPLDNWLKAVILTRWPTRADFEKFLAKEAETIIPKLTGNDLFIGGIVFPASKKFLATQFPRLPEELKKLAEKNWKIKAA